MGIAIPPIINTLRISLKKYPSKSYNKKNTDSKRRLYFITLFTSAHVNVVLIIKVKWTLLNKRYFTKIHRCSFVKVAIVYDAKEIHCMLYNIKRQEANIN